ncbi:MAG: hypothetical protein AAF986_00275 [Pseudomonadota bacterium]
MKHMQRALKFTIFVMVVTLGLYFIIAATNSPTSPEEEEPTTSA